MLALNITWFGPTNTSHLMTLILQYITFTSRYLLALALNVNTVIFTFVGCTHFMVVSNQSVTYQRGVTTLDQEHCLAPKKRQH